MTAVEKLRGAADETYRLYPNSCSHAVWHVIKQYTPDRVYVRANSLLVYLECDLHWKPVTVPELEKFSEEGNI